MFEKITFCILKHPHRFLVTPVLIALIFAVLLPLLPWNISKWVSPIWNSGREKKEELIYKDAEANFGKPPYFTIILESEDLFQPGNLRVIREITEELNADPKVIEALSLSSLEVFVREPGLTMRRPLLQAIPDNSKALNQLKIQAVSNPVLVNTVLNPNGNLAAIHVLVAGSETRGNAPDRLLERIEKRLESAHAQLSPHTTIRVAGELPHGKKMDQAILRDLTLLTPIALIVVALILIFYFRSVLAVGIPVVIGVLTIAATFGFLKFCGIGLSSLLALVPAILLTIGCVEDIHILSEFARWIRKGHSREKAVARVFEHVGKPVCYSFLTTLIGFAILLFHPLHEVSRFAFVAGFGLSINFLLTISFMPSVLRLCPVPIAFRKAHEEPFQKLFSYLSHSIIAHPGRKLAIVIAVTGTLSLGMLKLNVGTNFRDASNHFASERPEALVGDSNTEEWIPFSIILETGQGYGVQDPENFQAIEKFNRKLKDEFLVVFGYTDLISSGIKALNPGSTVSDLTRQKISDFTGNMTARARRRLIDFDASRTVIYVRHPVEDSGQMMSIVQKVEELASSILPPNISTVVTGKSVIFSKKSQSLGLYLIRDLAVIYLAIAILIAFLLRSPLHGLVAMIPNLLPVTVTLGLMGWIGNLLSSSSYPFAVLVLVIAVNDTIHFFGRYFESSVKGMKPDKAVIETLSCEIRPVICTSAGLCVGFLVLLFASFPPLRQIGYFVSAGLLTALICDLIISPLLLLRFPYRDREKTKT